MKTNEPIETDDPAYQQMMRSFEQIPNIDIHVDSDRVVNKKTTDEPAPAQPRKKTAKKTITRTKANTGTKKDSYAGLVVSPETKKKLLLAKSLLEATTGERLSMDDFLSILLAKGFKKISSSASDIFDVSWAMMQDTDTKEE